MQVASKGAGGRAVLLLALGVTEPASLPPGQAQRGHLLALVLIPVAAVILAIGLVLWHRCRGGESLGGKLDLAGRRGWEAEPCLSAWEEATWGWAAAPKGFQAAPSQAVLPALCWAYQSSPGHWAERCSPYDAETSASVQAVGSDGSVLTQFALCWLGFCETVLRQPWNLASVPLHNPPPFSFLSFQYL